MPAEKVGAGVAGKLVQGGRAEGGRMEKEGRKEVHHMCWVGERDSGVGLSLRGGEGLVRGDDEVRC